MKNWIFNNKKWSVQKSGFVWNTCSGMIFAFQSVFLLMVITRVLGLYDAGIFTLAYANANLFLTIGKYGMRNFQVTDVVGQFEDKDYIFSRYVSVLVMIIISVSYVMIKGYTSRYTSEKVLVILLVCFLKVLDAIEDVFLGVYHSKGRLDIAGKIMTLRLIVTLLCLILAVSIFKSLLVSLVITCLFSLMIMLVLLKITIPFFINDKIKCNIQKVKKLLIACTPICMANFLSFYIGNSQKYAIDRYMSDEVQACYGFISMPVFVIGLLNSFIYQPMLTQLASEWEKKNYKPFFQKIFFEIGIIVAITLIAEIGAYVCGIPVLSFIYSVNLIDYKIDLLILLLGGGFLAFSGFLVVVLIIMRMQKSSVLGYLFTAIIALILSPVSVNRYGVRGATVMYTILMGILSISFLIMILLGYTRKIKSK